jgi:flagellar biosynthesis/type III secretory pathway chaperone
LPTDVYETVKCLVDEELSLYRSLGTLVDDEETRVKQSDMEGLLDVLQRKQAIISRQESLLEDWDKISGALGVDSGKESPIFWNALAERVGAQGYGQIVGLIDEIKALGQELLDREGDIRGALEENLAEMRATLLRMGRNRTALRGYSKGVATSF